MYSDMFDMAANEQELLQKLSNPTRQAVLVARAYNSKARGLVTDKSASDGSSQDDSNEIPAFVVAINQLRDDIFSPVVAEEPEVQEELDDQISFFDQDPLGAILALEKDEEAEDEDDEVIEPEQTTEEPITVPSDDTVEVIPPEEAAPAEESKDEPETESADEQEKQAEPAPETPAAEPEKEPIKEEPAVPAKTIDEIFSYADPEPEVKTVRKANVFLLLLYIIFAIPVTVVGIAVLLIPTIICLGIAAISIFSGVAVLSAAFTSFSVIADLLVIVGLAVVLLAVGLLFLWSFLWFVVGAIIGLIRGVVELGGKWCYKNKEVPVNG